MYLSLCTALIVGYNLHAHAHRHETVVPTGWMRIRHGSKESRTCMGLSNSHILFRRFLPLAFGNIARELTCLGRNCCQ